MNNLTVTKQSIYRGLPLIENQPEGFYVEILEIIYYLMQLLLKNTDKVRIYRFDLHFPKDSNIEYSKDNQLFINFNESLRRHLERKYMIEKIHYVWVREQKASLMQHYHVCYFFPIYTGFIDINIAVKLWNRAVGLPINKESKLVHGRFKDFYKSNEYSKIDKFKFLSYLAKVAQKEQTPKFINVYNSSVNQTIINSIMTF